MEVVIIRHGKVLYNWTGWCTSDAFDKSNMEYDRAPIENKSYKVPDMDYRAVYISSLPRSRGTAVNIFGGSDFRQTGWIDEVPLKSGFDTKVKLPLWFWNSLGRIQWFLNCPRQEEGRAGTKKRARRFVEKLCAEGVDSAVVTHGFFMHTLLRELKRKDFRTDKLRIAYKNGEYVIAERH